MDRLLSEKAVLEAILGEPTDAHYPSWYADKVRKLPSAEITLEQVKAYCEPRCLSVVTNELVRYWEDETKHHNADGLHKHYEHYHGMENLLSEPQIIRCKECKHYEYGICKKAGLCVNKSPNGFCDWGER